MNNSTPESSTSALASTPFYWTTPRLELAAWLQEKAPSLNELYSGSLKMIHESPAMPGRVRFISHAVRELRNRLPEYVSRVKGDGPLNYKNELDELATCWRKTSSSTNNFAATGTVPREASVSIPSDVYERIDRLIQKHLRAREKPRESASRLFETLLPENDVARVSVLPQLNQWLEVTKWFTKQTHDNKKSDKDYKWDEFLQKFELFEVSLVSLIRGFFHTTGSLVRCKVNS